MRFFRREVWSYAVLLIVLFCIAALAARATITYIEGLLPPGQDTDIASILIWALTLGFMLIAGAFALWAIKFSAEAETRRRIGRLVDAMDYLSDGLLVVDRKGRITGSNPAVAKLLKATPTESQSLRDLLPALAADDVSSLTEPHEPNEIECNFVTADGTQILRLRSQPSDDLIIVVISDITKMNSQRLHSRQMARLQLIGQLARGVAHDLNSLLSGISGHASLLPRLRPGTAEMARSLEAITQASEQGVALAGHLLELAQPVALRQPTDAIGEHVGSAIAILKDVLPANWRVEESIEDQIPPVSLSGLQVEQIVLNLGLLAADVVGASGILKVSVGQPGPKALFNVGSAFGAVILVTAGTQDTLPVSDSGDATVQDVSRESGIIQSVIHSMIEEAGGVLYNLTAPDRTVIYRVTLPRRTFAAHERVTGLPDEVKAYLANWTVLFARPARAYGALDRRLTELGVRLTSVDSVISALARIEEDKNIDVMILDKYLLGQEAKGLLKAILKLQPTAGIVVLCDDPASESEGLSPDVIFVEAHADPNKAVVSLVEARNLALRRKPIRRSLSL